MPARKEAHLKLHTTEAGNGRRVIVNQSAPDGTKIHLYIDAEHNGRRNVLSGVMLTAAQAIELATNLIECHTAALKAETEALRVALKR